MNLKAVVRFLVTGSLLGGGLLGGLASTSAAAKTSPTAGEPVLKVGVATSLSPPGTYQLGRQALKAIQAFAKWNNSHHTGVDIQIVGVEDDKGSPATGRTVVQQLIQKGAEALVGDMSSAIATADQPLVDQAKIVRMISGSWATTLTGSAHPYNFRVGAANALLARDGVVPYMVYLHKTKGWTRFGFLVEDSAYGLGMMSSIEKLAKKTLPGVKLDVQDFPTGSTTVTAQELALKKSNPQAVTIISVEATKNLAIPQAYEVGLAPAAKLICNWTWPVYTTYWKITGKDGVGVAYVAFTTPYQKLDPEGELAAKEMGGKPTIWAAWAWDSMEALELAASKAHSGAPAKVAAELAKVHFQGATGTVSFETSGPYYHDRVNVPAYVLDFTKEGDKATQATLLWSESTGGS